MNNQLQTWQSDNQTQTQTHLLHLSSADAHVRINAIFAGLIAAGFPTQERHATLHAVIMSPRQRRILVQGVITGKRNSRWRLYHVVKQTFKHASGTQTEA